MKRNLIYAMVAVVVMIIIGTTIYGDRALSTGGTVTVKFEGSYPWLVQGAYADYTAINVGEPPWFVTSSGQLLSGAPEQFGTPNTPVNGTLPGDGSASLNWTVANRSGNNVLLNVSFHNEGCQDNETAYMIENQTAAPCTYYNFASSIFVLVNLTNDEAYVNGVDQGLINFWEAPLLENATVNDGSVFVNQQRFDSLANVSVPFESTSLLLPPGMEAVNVSGTPFTSPIKLYGLTPSTFGIPLSNYYIGWIHGSGLAFGSQIQENSFGPSGDYDFYNGLAYQFSMPQFAINQSICRYNNGQPLDCELANVSTTLGQYFRSGLGTFLLRSTNISLAASQQSPSQQFTNSPNTYQILEVAVPILAALCLTAFVIRRRHIKH